MGPNDSLVVCAVLAALPLEYSGQPPLVNSKEDVPIFQEWSKLRREAAIGKAIGGFVLFLLGFGVSSVLYILLGIGGVVIGIAVAVLGIYMIVIGFREDSRILKLRKAIVEQTFTVQQVTPNASPGLTSPSAVVRTSQTSSPRPCPHCGTMNERDWSFCQRCAKPLPASL